MLPCYFCGEPELLPGPWWPEAGVSCHSECFQVYNGRCNGFGVDVITTRLQWNEPKKMPSPGSYGPGDSLWPFLAARAAIFPQLTHLDGLTLVHVAIRPPECIWTYS